jgi:hypothetical protein
MSKCSFCDDKANRTNILIEKTLDANSIFICPSCICACIDIISGDLIKNAKQLSDANAVLNELSRSQNWTALGAVVPTSLGKYLADDYFMKYPEAKEEKKEEKAEDKKNVRN